MDTKVINTVDDMWARVAYNADRKVSEFIDETMKLTEEDDKKYMLEAFEESTKSTCKRAHVGVVIADKMHIYGRGTNDAIDGHPTCKEVGCLMVNNHCKRTVHAEMNAIIHAQAMINKHCTLYTTHYPCPDCMKHINQAGIKRVVYLLGYNHDYTNHFSDGIEIVKIPQTDDVNPQRLDMIQYFASNTEDDE